MPVVFVISRDWPLRGAVRAQLLHSGVEALGMESVDDLSRAVASGITPSAVVLDAELIEPLPASLANLARRVPVIVVASRTTQVPEFPSAAAVLHRPVSVGEIVLRVKELLAGEAA